MNKFKIAMGATALIVAAVAIVACNKEKIAQQEVPAPQQQIVAPNDYTLAEMIEAMSWEEGKAFFENQPIKDYSAVCEQVVKNDCGITVKTEGLPYVVLWVWRMPNGGCNSNYSGSCIIFRPKEDSLSEANALGYFEGGKFVIIPTVEENGFTADGYLAIGSPIEIEEDSVVIQEGIYAAYFDEETGKYSAVAVDYYMKNCF